MARPRQEDPTIQIRDGRRGKVYFIRCREDALGIKDGRPIIKRVQRQKPIGPVSIGIRAAQRIKAEIMRGMNRDGYAVQSHIPFEQFVSIYRSQHLPLLADTTQRTYDQWLRIYIEPAFKGRKLSEIRTLDLQAFLLDLPVSPATRTSIRGILASIWKKAKAWGYWREVSPLEGVCLGPRRPARAKVIWEPKQISRILGSVRPDVQLICETLMWTGMRISECLALQPAAFNLKQGTVAITQRHSRGSTQGTKSERSERTLELGYLTERYRAHLRGLNPHAWVFPAPNHPERPYRDCELLANYLSPILVKLGMKQPGTGWHTFRRSLASWMNAAGASQFDVRDQLGHSKLDTTAIYVQTQVKRGEIIRSLQSKFMAVLCADCAPMSATQ